ncbi:MAG: peptide chain release factor N(5)-glutamine methyltransferase [Syntrophaceae bacterium]|nr:peptide chain release factor N(5)-glutamine methyltransferase [Syntrophaceae bacterium]
MDIASVLKKSVSALENQGLPTPRLDAEVLLSSLLKKRRTDLYSHPGDRLTEKEYGDFRSWIERRKHGEPVAYIVGKKEFWSLPFEVSSHVLIPRPETEILVEEVLKVCAGGGVKNPRILEIGTGCGAISVSLASELKEAYIVATDISREAIAVAMKNAHNNGVRNQISFLIGDLFQPVSGKFDIIVSNPPYISEEEYDHLPSEIREFEPRLALCAGTYGTEYHDAIITEGILYLEMGGSLLMEMGAGQKDRIENMLKESHLYDSIARRSDYGGIDRISIARRFVTGG